MSIKISDLTKSYGSQKAVDGISFEVNKGEVVGFIGPNGSGKSTTMKCICGIIPPGSGMVEVAGIDVQKDNLAVKRIIGYLPENNPLYLDMYVKEYLLHIAHYYLEKKICRKRVDEIVIDTGLVAESHKKIGQLSKGYKQRVGLAQALLHSPEVLILDEPTTGLDPNQIVEIRNLISEFSKNKTVLLSTHILQEVEAICDRVVILDQGKIVANGTAEIIRNTEHIDKQTIFVEFNQAVEMSLLLKLQGVDQVQKISEKEYLLSGSANINLREHIFNFATQNGLMLLTIQKKEGTLEESFRKLTSKT
jgi:ABC-2 type transport system ATP-binding protein